MSFKAERLKCRPEEADRSKHVSQVGDHVSKMLMWTCGLKKPVKKEVKPGELKL